MLFEWFPKWTIIIVFAIITGTIGGIWHPFFRPSKYVLGDFYWGGFLGLMLIFPTFNVLAYLSLDQTIHFQTEYNIFSPGPPRIKSERCEYGIRLKEIYTGSGFHFALAIQNRKPKKTQEPYGLQQKRALLAHTLLITSFLLLILSNKYGAIKVDIILALAMYSKADKSNFEDVQQSIVEVHNHLHLLAQVFHKFDSRDYFSGSPTLQLDRLNRAAESRL